jgi:ABC-type uncharacterized transport system substrate-binding protein
VKYRDKPIGVIVAIGNASLDYLMRWRSTLWPRIPVAFAMVDETTVARLNPGTDVTGLMMKLDLTDAIKAARAVVPDLKRVVVVGDIWEKQAIFRHWKDQISTIAADVEISEMIGLTMRELRQQVATLPDHTAIVYTAIYSDGEGTYYPPADALAFIAETANRPVVVPAESNIGRGGIGGFVMIPSLIGESVGELALRVLKVRVRQPFLLISEMLFARFSIGVRCSAGALRSQVCHQAAKSVSVRRPPGTNIEIRYCSREPLSYCKPRSSLGCYSNDIGVTGPKWRYAIRCPTWRM